MGRVREAVFRCDAGRELLWALPPRGSPPRVCLRASCLCTCGAALQTADAAKDHARLAPEAGSDPAGARRAGHPDGCGPVSLLGPGHVGAQDPSKQFCWRHSSK